MLGLWTVEGQPAPLTLLWKRAILCHSEESLCLSKDTIILNLWDHCYDFFSRGCSALILERKDRHLGQSNSRGRHVRKALPLSFSVPCCESDSSFDSLWTVLIFLASVAPPFPLNLKTSQKCKLYYMISFPHSLSFTPKPLKSGVCPFPLLKMLLQESPMIQILAWMEGQWGGRGSHLRCKV